MNERILVVDDEKGVVRSCVKILERAGFTVSGQTESVEAPELLKQEAFDLLLTDIKMPKIDGLKLLEIAKEIDPHMAVVLITGYGTMEDAIQAIQLGAEGFLMKPFEPNELISTVQDNLSRRALLRDSLRLQTLLPLLEINQILQVSGGEISLVKRVLEITLKATSATRIAWLSCRFNLSQSKSESLIEATVVPNSQPPSQLPQKAITEVLTTGKAIWVAKNGALFDDHTGHPNITGALLPLTVKGEIVGILTAEIGNHHQTGPFGQISLELLSLLAGQLAMMIENVQLFQQTETLRAFNEDIIQNMTNGLIAVDRNNHITAFNPAASKMLDQQIDDVLHQPLNNFIADADMLVKVFNDTVNTGQPQPRQEVAIQRRDGHTLPISVSTAPLRREDNQQEMVGVVGVIEDLSEIKALEAQQRQLDRLAALGEMSAVVAHEIRNPIAGIAAGVDYLTRNMPQGSVESEGAALIQSEIKRVNRILEDILFVARPLQLNLSKQTITDIIERVIQRNQPRAETRGVQICYQSSPNLPELEVDSQRLEQVFSNLIINAIQAMPDGGEIAININHSTSMNNGVTLTISDTGPGIPQNVQTRIFEPFFTTKTKGTGLGLSIARQIIEAHHGTITLNRKANQGTQFTIHLPAA